MAKVLLVEDEELLIRMYRTKLELENFEVDIAQDGEKGLAKIREFKPDLVLLDIVLPKLNGIEVLKRIRAEPELKEIPVVILTNASIGDSVKECLEAGALGYIIKSDSTPEQLVQQIRTFLVLSEVRYGGT